MGGPRLYGNSAQCLFEKAKTVIEGPDTAGNGIIVTYAGNCDTAITQSGDAFNGGGGGGGPGACALCNTSGPSIYDQACCDAFGDNFYASKVAGSNIWCSSC